MIELFFLVLARTGGLFLGAPVFSTQSLPRRFRAALAVLISFTLLPVASGRPLPENAFAVAGGMVYELMVGFGLGLLVRLALSAFQLAGAMIAFQAGFAMAAAFDPISDSRSTVIQTLHLNFVTVLFLLLDGHHLLLRGLAASYEMFPVASGELVADLTRTLFAEGKVLFETGARVAAPVTGLLLLVNGVVGFLNRILPQLSIFNIGFPMQVFAGLTALSLSIPGVAMAFMQTYGRLEGVLADLFGS